MPIETPPTIYDVFLYAGEREALNIRLHELDGLVDRHIAVCGDRTFQGEPQQVSVFDDVDRDWVRRSTLHQVTVRDFPEDAGPWEREAHQRNAMLAALAGLNTRPDDVVLLSDVDEVPRRASIPRSLEPGETYRLCQRHFSYWLNCEVVTWGHWHGTRVIRLDDLRKTTPQALRGFGEGHLHRPEDRPGGWHFSFLGGEQAILSKLRSWAHTEALPLATSENVARALERLEDWDPQRGAQFVFVPLDLTFPACVVAHPSRYSTLQPMPAPIFYGQWLPYGHYGESVPQ